MFALPDYSAFAKKAEIVCLYLAIITGVAAPISTAVTSFAYAGFFLAWLVSGQILKTLHVSLSQPAGKAILVFFIWLAIGMLYAPTSWHDKVITLLSWKKIFFTLILLGLFIEKKWKHRFIFVYMIVMTLSVSISWGLWLLGLPVLDKELGIIMTNHTSQSMAFVAASLCCLYLWSENSFVNKQWLLIAFLLFASNILFISASRSGYLALPVAIIFVIICLNNRKHLLSVLLVVLTVFTVAYFTSTMFKSSIEKGVEESASYKTSENFTSIGARMIFLENTLELIKQRPLIGYGTSSFKNVYGAYAEKKYNDWRGEPVSDPHNQYLFVWFENGLIGLLLFLGYIFTVLKQSLSGNKFAFIAAGFMLAVCSTSFFNSHFKTFPEGFLLAFFIGILLARDEQIVRI
ncbi:MAG: polymerase [Methylobacter sp.]|nr:MAG: polymerase [Methylobacter sp.]PPD17454.1 MAG: polymerase [Methylobacter sp.]PPD36142.1 MAG: polymerase [Methylomonas sp.]